MSAAASRSQVALVGVPHPAVVALAGALGAGEPWPAPEPPKASGFEWGFAATLHEWREKSAAALRGVERIVVCTWPRPSPPRPCVELDAGEWWLAAEWETALGFTALQVAAAACADGGSIVAVVERPAALDSVGRAPLVAVAEGLITFARSLALGEGARGVRINVVSSEIWTAPARLHGSPPPLASFPGRAEVEVAGAVRMLLSADASGVTGSVVRADCGRSW
jgi:NAD(P)-dependent dehydrogenase (short-subunit alcohol dehydrogenase family)